ncbi:HPr-rel-A system PqqD family peptide chaperone [Massilia sp. IC2-278]|uniref:HPr-rel-A system PqqD family peptide chaperone n=1 Tax=Massilia sp. IC2-278 TaxID=2887200 RepID=UPI001E61305A|nr:HPr-rel-A system PqqD family peptide chaperone [Massilia sp. IC2-278]MCC2959936.1 HPr-rel-A system PqqD family peptide chaperone [Massilia sp. IC2-278]
MSSPPIWRLAPGQRLVHRCHDGECVLFNDLTGDTHLLGQDVLDLLGALRDTPRSAAGLAQDAGAGIDPDPEWLAELDELLADLAALDLVAPLPGTQPC